MDHRSWLDRRLLATPGELAEAVRALLGESADPVPGRMAACALATFARIARGPQTRECALELLAADALLTYAFEAAADPVVGGSGNAALQLARSVGPCGDLGRLAAEGA
ncbi:MAG: hypothetical protein OEU54_13025 [Gemmatimonadota bacterium]|nr:hypothetical protein [Gemmatimonadota bacterium]